MELSVPLFFVEDDELLYGEADDKADEDVLDVC